MHAYHLRRLAEIPAAGRGLVVELRVRRLVRRLVCQNSSPAISLRGAATRVPCLVEAYAICRPYS